ncbi:MAG TPA: hypothetical protein VI455_00785 [Terriglobia bacterium]
MTIKRMYCLTAAALLSVGLTTLSLAVPSPQQSGEAAPQPASLAPAGDQEKAPPSLQETASAAIGNPFENPFAVFGPSVGEDADVANGQAQAAAPVAYPAGAPMPKTTSPSSWAPTHFEIMGFAQWRNLSSSSGFSSTYCLPSGCVTNIGSFSNNLGLSGFGVGPLFRFTWTPEKKILGATSEIWVDYGSITRTRTRNIAGSLTFLGVTYVIDTTLQAQLKDKNFEIGYAPRWGNDKFRIGPEIVYGHVGVDFTLTNQTSGAPPPINQSLNIPNNLVLLGIDFDYRPVQQFDVYGRSGWVPCCGGGYHVNETEFGAKYYIRRNFSILGGFKYDYLKRDFNVPATTVTTELGSATIGPFSGFIKFPGIGPFIGASVRF